MGDSDFSDDEEFFESAKRLDVLKNQTKPPALETSSKAAENAIDIPAEVKKKLYQADGEIAILRKQLEQSRLQGYEESKRIQNNFDESNRSMEDQIKNLKFMVLKLEDEKKFLDYQVKSNVPKKLKVDESQNVVVRKEPKEERILGQRIIRIQNDTTLLTDYIWRQSINGSGRTIMDYLGKIVLNNDIKVQNFTFPAQVPLSGIILEYLVGKKDLRLDILLEGFFDIILLLIEDLVTRKMITSVPFLLSLLHCVLGFKPSAVNEKTLVHLATVVFSLMSNFTYTLGNDDPELFGHNKTPQLSLLEKFSLVCGMDLCESTMKLCNLHQEVDLGTKLMEESLFSLLCQSVFQRNNEAFINTVQINILYNIVEIFSNLYATNENITLSSDLVQQLININLIDIPIKEDFRFYGLNRCIGNNVDFPKLDGIIFTEDEVIDPRQLITLPNPIPISIEDSLNDEYNVKFKHEHHILDLRLKISRLIENYVVDKMDVSCLKDVEIVKLIIRTINFEQSFILRSPRSKFVNLRIKIIASWVKNLFFLFSTSKKLNEIINSEALNELSVVLSRIAFSSDTKISSSATELYIKLRKLLYQRPILNKECEGKAREINNVTLKATNRVALAEVEANYPNGLENPYDSETVELSREILGFCIDNEVADNLFINMNGFETVYDKFDDKEINEM